VWRFHVSRDYQLKIVVLGSSALLVFQPQLALACRLSYVNIDGHNAGAGRKSSEQGRTWPKRASSITEGICN
jgi:hypothetical protein